MKWIASLKIAIKALKAHKTRTLLASLGIMIGIAAVIIMVAIGKGSQREVMEVIAGMGENLVTINAGEMKRRGGRLRLTGNVTTLTMKDSAALKEEVSGIEQAVPYEYKQIKVKYKQSLTETHVAGTQPEFLDVRNYQIERGEGFTERDVKMTRRVAVIGQTTIKNIFGEDDPVGQTIRIKGIPFKIIGTFFPKGLDSNNMDQDDIVLIPITSLLRRVLNQTHITTIYARASSRQDIAQITEQIRSVLRDRHRLTSEKDDDFSIVSQVDLEDMKRETTELFTHLIVGVAAISLVVGGVGILAVMLISVKERTREVGVRRAVGASRRDIVQQFLLESLVLGFLGGGIGVVSGVVITLGLIQWGPWSLVLDLKAAAIGTGICTGIGLIFGIYPALKASRLDPMVALTVE